MSAHRFIAFISRRTEMAEYSRRLPKGEVVFASYAALGSDVVRIDPHRLDAMIGHFQGLHRTQPFVGVLNRKEKCVVPAALLAQVLGVRPILAQPLLARDKFLMREALNGNERFPRTVLISSASDVGAVPEEMFPCVLKPRFGFNSRSVCLARTSRELRLLLEDQLARYRELPKEDGTPADFVVEDFVSGSEHTIETLVKDGQPLFHLLSDKMAMSPPFFVEVGDLMPSALPSQSQSLCREAATIAIARLGIRNAWTHTEIRLHRGRAVVIECAARMGGGYFEEMIQTVFGIDRLQMLIDLHLDRVPLADPLPRCWVAGRRYVLDGRCDVHAFHNGADLFSDPDLHLVWPAHLHDIPRLIVGPPLDFNNTVFEFLARATSAPAAMDKAEGVLRGAVLSITPLLASQTERMRT